MSGSPAQWRDDGTPVSVRFGDMCRRAGAGGLQQARQVFLQGAGLLPEGDQPAAWVGAPCWAVLETGFGLGLNFLATWHAWRHEPRRPARLFYSAVEAFVCEPADLIRSAAPFPELAPLAAELAAQWRGLLPGVHRLNFESERLRLTLAVGEVQPMLAELSGQHDTIYLDGFSPERNPDMWSAPTLQAVARLARPGARAATWCVAAAVRDGLHACGFEVQRVPGLPPKRHALRARFAPRWAPRTSPTAAVQPGRCVVVGAGLAGASAAFSLAQRGWQVTVLDRAAAPAAGASGLPAGVVAPHVSPDDRPLSRLSRAGVQATLARAALLLRPGIDYAVCGVLERPEPGKRRLPQAWQAADHGEATRAQSLDASHPLTQERARMAGLPVDEAHPALWHAQAGWVRSAALVRAMLQAPGIHWRGGVIVARIERSGAHWRLLDGAGTCLAQADLLVLAAGFDTLALLGTPLPLNPLRGQVAFGPMPGGVANAALPPFAVNGHGSLVAHLPSAHGAQWVTGSTFERANPHPALTATDHAANQARLAELLPAAAHALQAQWADGRAQAWAGVRATLPDRLPAVGAWPGPAANKNTGLALAQSTQDAIDLIAPLPLQLCTGLGARGLTLAVLSGELLAATLHGEPLPLARSLARHLRAGRFAPAAPPPSSTPP